MRFFISFGLLLVAATANAQNVSVGTATAAPGVTAYGTLAIPAGSDTATSIDVAVINGARSGKTVAFIAGSHGTEYASIVALTRLITRIDPRSLTGTVIVAPLLNVPSFEQMTVHVNPVDRKGMNASYPGDEYGTQTQRALAAVRREIVDKADVIVDLHGGDLDEDLTPYSYWMRSGNAALDSASHKLVLAFGLPLVIVNDVDTSNPAQTRSLSGYALLKSKLTLVAEAGRVGTVAAADVDALVNGSLNLLASLGMLARSYEPVSQPAYVEGGSRVRAEKPGMFYASVARGTRVQKDQVIGYTTDYVGRGTGDVRAPATGLVTFIRGVPSMWAGATLVNVSPEITTSSPQQQAPSSAHAQPLGAPWDSVGAILQTTGVKNPDHFRYTFPRRDITLRMGDVTVAPALALGSWVAFTGTGAAAQVMGDLVLLPEELPAVSAELKRQQIDITAIHNHLAGSTPAILYVHVHGNGRALALAGSIARVLAHTATPRPVSSSAPGPLGIDTTLVFRTLGRSGRAQGKVAQLSFNLVPGVVKMHGETIPAGPGYATPINIQMVDGTRAVATGDFAITGTRTQAVLQALTEHGITPTAMHTHLVDEMPRIYYIHFWADGKLTDVLTGLRAALDAAR